MKSSQSPTPQPIQDIDDEIDLAELWSAIYKRKKLILITSFSLALIMAIVAIIMENKYQADVLLAPATTESGNGLSGLASQYGGLASMAGIDLPSGGAGNITQEAISVLQSKKFIYQFIQKKNLKPILFPKRWDKETNLWKKPSFNPISEVKSLILGQPKAVNYAGKELLKPGEPSSLLAYEFFTKNILNISQDKKTKFVTLSIEFNDPVLARDLANQLVTSVNEQLRQEHIQQSKKTIQFLKQTLPKVKLVELKEIIFRLIEENTKSITLATTREDYIFKVLDPAVVPENKSSPKRGLMVMVGFILGLMLGVFIALILNWKEKNTHNKPQNMKTPEL